MAFSFHRQTRIAVFKKPIPRQGRLAHFSRDHLPAPTPCAGRSTLISAIEASQYRIGEQCPRMPRRHTTGLIAIPADAQLRPTADAADAYKLISGGARRRAARTPLDDGRA